MTDVNINGFYRKGNMIYFHLFILVSRKFQQSAIFEVKSLFIFILFCICLVSWGPGWDSCFLTRIKVR